MGFLLPKAEETSISASGREAAHAPRRSKRKLWQAWLFVVLGALAFRAPAGASVALLLEQPYGHMGAFNPTGHSALYFDHICAQTPVELRPCEAGERGVVISRYDGIGDYDWVAVPLLPYLYAVSDPDEIPGRVDRLSALRLRDLYRRAKLQKVAPDTAEGGMPQGNWYELVGSAFDRTIYGFQVNTTAKQDEQIIAHFNDHRNREVYNGAFNNCADFARSTLNLLFPHAVRRNYIADFGLTTPKSVARGLAHYAHKHPQLGLSTFVVPQLAGDLPRSMGVEGVTESLLKRYGLPLLILSPHITAVVLVAYVGRGRFDLPKDAPVLQIESANTEARTLIAESDSSGTEQVAAETETPTAVSGGVPAGGERLTMPWETGGTDGGPDSSSTDLPFVCEGCMVVPFLP